MFSLLKDCAFSVVEPAAAAAQTELVSITVDMAGYDAICFLAFFGDVTVASVLTLTVKSNPTDSVTGGTTEKASAAHTATAGDADSTLLIVDVLRPSQRYVFASLTRTAADAVGNGVIAIRYNSKSLPVTQSTTHVLAVSALGGPVG